MSKRENESRVVCVTGASGYIASCLVKLLLLRGYTVHATLRNLYDPAKTEHLMRLEGAKERLHLFKADLMEEGSFDSAISGCQGVFHVASPVIFNINDPQVDVLDPAIKVLFNGVPRSPEVVVDETWFSKPEYCDEYPQLKWYVISKLKAEEAAWKFCKENSIDLISMNPGMVIGPMLQPTLNETVALIFNLINGAETYPNVAMPWIHVEDVAEAHIRAFEMHSAHGRYCLVESVVHHSEIVNLLHDLHDPSLQIPHKCADDGPLEKTYQVSKAKVKSLGIDFIPLKISVKDTVESIKDKKLL